MYKKIIIRCDAGKIAELGTGHLYRCITLYFLLKKKFKIKVMEKTTPNDVIIHSCYGDILHKEKFTPEQLNETVFLLSEEVDKCIVNLNYKNKDFEKTIDLL